MNKDEIKSGEITKFEYKPGPFQYGPIGATKVQVVYGHPLDVADELNALLSDGWTLHGGPSAIARGDDEINLVQLVTKVVAKDA